MWTILNDTLNSCQLLLLLVLFFFSWYVIQWTIQKTKGKLFPCLQKKQKKHLKSWITPLEEAMETCSETERRLSEDQNLMYTLQTLDKNIHYLAWQMRRITGSIPHSASSSSADSVTSICSWTRTSAKDTPFTQSVTPLSYAPTVQKEEDRKWQLSLVGSPREEFQQIHQESLSHHRSPRVEFQQSCQKTLSHHRLPGVEFQESHQESLSRQRSPGMEFQQSCQKTLSHHRLPGMEFQQSCQKSLSHHRLPGVEFQQSHQESLFHQRSPGTEFQQSHQEPPTLSHHKVDFSKSQKQEKARAPTPQSKTLTRLIPVSLSLCPIKKGPQVHRENSRLCFLDYKEQELLDWHIQRKHQPKEVALLPLTSGVITGTEIRALTGTVGPPSGGKLPRGSPQPPPSQRSHSHTPPQVIIQGCHTLPPPQVIMESCHTPPKPHSVRSPGPLAWPPLPAPEDLLPSPTLICKTESHSSIRSVAEGKVAGSLPKEDLPELLCLLGPNKNPIFRESGRPGTPKEKEKDCHNSNRRTNPSKEVHGCVGRANTPKVKQEDAEINALMDRKLRKLCWADGMAEAQKASRVLEQSASACPKFLDPLFMCQNQLEMPCIAAARVELQDQECQPFAKPLRCGGPKPQCLAHTIVESLDMKQTMQDLHMCLAKGLGNRSNQPSVEYPICLLCGRCTPYCPHPRSRHSPCLLVYPRLSVEDGEVHMTLGFILKIKRSEADDWGLVQGMDTLKAERGRERPSKKERSRSKSRRRRGHGRSRRHHSRGQDKAKQRALEGADLRIKSRGTVQRTIESTTAPVSPQPHKKQRRRPHRKQVRLVKDEEEEPSSTKFSSILKRVLSCIRTAWAKVRGRREKAPLKRGMVAFSSKPQNHPPSPEEEAEQEEEVLSVVSHAPELSKKGGNLLNRTDSLLNLAPETSPQKWTSKGQPETALSRKGSPRSRRRAFRRITEPEPPWVTKKGTGRSKK